MIALLWWLAGVDAVLKFVEACGYALIALVVVSYGKPWGWE